MKLKPASKHRPAGARKLQRKATTFRFSPTVQKRLELLGKLKKAPLNRLVNLAVEQYVAVNLATAEANLTDTLNLVKAARLADPDFESAISDFVDAEATLASVDPVEGKLVEPPKRTAIRKGKATQALREILNA